MKKMQQTMSLIIILSLVLSCFSCFAVYGEELSNDAPINEISKAQLDELIESLDQQEILERISQEEVLKLDVNANRTEDIGGLLTLVDQDYNSATFTYVPYVNALATPLFCSKKIDGEWGELESCGPDATSYFTVDIEPFADYSFCVLNVYLVSYDPETGPEFDTIWSNYEPVDGTPDITLTGSAYDVSIGFSWTATTPFQYPEPIIYDFYINGDLMQSSTYTGWGSLMFAPEFDHVGYVEAYLNSYPDNKVTSNPYTVTSNPLPDPSPFSISIGNVTNDSVTLSWSCANPSVYTQYYIYDPVSFEFFYSTEDQYQTITDLQPDTEYTIVVVGSYYGFQIYSDQVTFKYSAYGDINRDGIIDINDQNLIRDHVILGIEFDEEQFTLADLNGDGFVNSTDLLIIKNYVAGNITSFPVGDYHVFTY